MDTPIFDLLRYLHNYCTDTKESCAFWYGPDCTRDHFSTRTLTDM